MQMSIFIQRHVNTVYLINGIQTCYYYILVIVDTLNDSGHVEPNLLPVSVDPDIKLIGNDL